MAVSRGAQGNTDIWLIDVVRGLGSRFTSDAAGDFSPLWSPDGRRLIFRSNRNGQFDLFEKPANGAADEQPLLVAPLDKGPLSWSPDGRFLLYTVQDPKSQGDLWALPLSGPESERKPFPVVQTNFDETQGQFSPDGRWLAYVSDETGQTGRYEVYVRPFPGPGGKWLVSTGGGIWPRWRRDGKELYYLGSLDRRMMAVPIQAASDVQTLSAGAPVPLFSFRSPLEPGFVGNGGLKAQYAVAPDGRFLLNTSVDDAASSPITIVQNWTAGLKP